MKGRCKVCKREASVTKHHLRMSGSRMRNQGDNRTIKVCTRCHKEIHRHHGIKKQSRVIYKKDVELTEEEWLDVIRKEIEQSQEI